MFNFVNDTTAVNVAEVGKALNVSLPNWTVLWSSGHYLLVVDK